MAKPRIERSLLFPNREFRERVRKASKDRGFRSEQAFILTACEREIRRGDDTSIRNASLRPAHRSHTHEPGEAGANIFKRS